MIKKKNLKFFCAPQLVEYLTLAMAAAIIFGPILYLEIFKLDSDFQPHLEYAKLIYSSPQDVPIGFRSHALWQWLVFVVRQVFNSRWDTAALILMIGLMIATSSIIYYYLRKNVSALIAGTLAIGVQFVAPLLFIETFTKLGNLVNGYIGPNVYHNPTIFLLKPLAILQFIFASEALLNRKAGWNVVLLTAVVSMAAIYAKPSYFLCLVPAFCVIGAIRLIKKQPINWKWLLFGIVIPSLPIIAWQYAITFGSASEGSIAFAPFVIVTAFSKKYLLLKYLLSIVFPLVVTLTCWKTAVRNSAIQMGWTGFAFGSILMYFFAEMSSRGYDGNLIWSAEISLFLLFLGCVMFLVENKDRLDNALVKWLVLGSGFLHLLFGAVFYFYVCYLPQISSL